MRPFFAGASEVIGRHLLPLLIDAGHTLGTVTRSPSKAGPLASAGAQAIVCDVFDRQQRTRAVRTSTPDPVLHELTGLPDNLSDLPGDSLLNARVRVKGTRNLLNAMAGLAQVRIVAQSVAWTMRPGREADAVSFSTKRSWQPTAPFCVMASSMGRARISKVNFPQDLAYASTKPQRGASQPSSPQRACCPSSTEANQQYARYSSSVHAGILHDASARKQAYHGYSNF
jgi:NAD dependent epimerase/dehydratase family